MTADLVAAHGSPLWLADAGAVRAACRAVARAFGDAWDGPVQVAASYKTNRTTAFLRAADQEGALAEVVCEAEYLLAREVIGVPGERVIVNGPAKPASLLGRAAEDDALVILDAVDEIGRAAAAGVRRAGLRVAVPGALGAASRFGIPEDEVPAAARRCRDLGLEVEVLHTHLVSTDLDAPPDASRPLAAGVRVLWPRPPDDHVAAAAMLARLAGRLAAQGVPVGGLDLGGGIPAPPAAAAHARAVCDAIRAEGFRGTVTVEPGRALFAGAVDLLTTVVAVKRMADGRRAVICDAGTNLLPGALWGWPSITAPGREGPTEPALVSGPLCLNTDVLHPAAALPADIAAGDVLAARGVGAYQQAQSTQFGDVRPAVLVRDGGPWAVARHRETVAELLGSEAAEVAASGSGSHRQEVP
ncbi:MAG: hypothetical protein IT200_03155 [Thermoleophilia bacterium]|nr:hypothetical protein [Thermoleophilia bacterium]